MHWYIVLGAVCATKSQNSDTVTRMQLITAVMELGQPGLVILNFSDQRCLRKDSAVLSQGAVCWAILSEVWKVQLSHWVWFGLPNLKCKDMESQDSLQKNVNSPLYFIKKLNQCNLRGFVQS